MSVLRSGRKALGATKQGYLWIADRGVRCEARAESLWEKVKSLC
jgi:hypothetical protein